MRQLDRPHCRATGKGHDSTRVRGCLVFFFFSCVMITPEFLFDFRSHSVSRGSFRGAGLGGAASLSQKMGRGHERVKGLASKLLLCVVAMVVVELCLLVPLIVIEREKDQALVPSNLQRVTAEQAKRLEDAVARFAYSVTRAAAAPDAGFLTQERFNDYVALDDSPFVDLRYAYVPLVTAAERAEFERFYGLNITDLPNGPRTGVYSVVPYNITNRTLFAPYALFAPPMPEAPVLGLDLLPFNNSETKVLRDEDKYLVIPTSIFARAGNSYNLLSVARNKKGRGWMLGAIDSRTWLETTLDVPRSDVTLAAFILAPQVNDPALYFDDSPLLGNASYLALFESLPQRSLFYCANVSAFNETVLLAVRYSAAFGAGFEGTTWVILVAVLAPLFALIDVIFVVVWLLLERQQRLHHMEESKRREAQVMISYVNHEIRNPLQTVLGLADVLLEKASDEGNRLLADDLETIVQSAEFIEHIARDILDLRRVEEGELEVEMAEVDIATLVSGLQKNVMLLQSRKQGVSFRVSVDPEIGKIVTDRYRLQQIVLNFLSNAFKHSESGEVVLSVAIANAEWIRVAVWDNGAGIPPERAEQLFEQFAQVSTADASERGGFGLGLYLTRMLAQLLGGKVGFQSTLGLGSVFWVDLPTHWNRMHLSFQFKNTETKLQRAVGLG